MSKARKRKLPLMCSICGEPILPDALGWTGGHNAEPINEGRCCGGCNGLVLTERFKRFEAGLPMRTVLKRPRGALLRAINAGLISTDEAHKQGYMGKAEMGSGLPMKG
jgi:hypothetical protein